MKLGMRKPSIKKSISARTTGKMKRAVKKSVNPTYGKKGMGIINDPKKAIYNKVYDKSTFDIRDVITNGEKDPNEHYNDPKNKIMDIRFRSGRGDIVNIDDHVFKVKRYGNDDVEIIDLSKIEKIEILDFDELVVFVAEKEFFRGVIDKPTYKKLKPFYKLMTGENLEMPKPNLTSIYIISLTILRLIAISFSLATLFKRRWVLLCVGIAFIVGFSVAKSILDENRVNTDVRKFGIYEDFILTGNAGLLYGFFAFVILLITLFFITILS